MTLKELQERKNKLAADIRAAANGFKKDVGWSAEDEAAWKKLNADYDQNETDLRSAVEAEESRKKAADEVQARLDALTKDERKAINLPDGVNPGTGDHSSQVNANELRDQALAGWLLGDSVYQSRHEHFLRAMQQCGIRPGQGEIDLKTSRTNEVADLSRQFRSAHHKHHDALAAEIRSKGRESRNLSAVTQATGGALVFPSFVNSLEVNMLAFGGMRQVAQTIVTSHGERMVWPTADDTSNTGQLLGENTSFGSSVDPSFAGVAWDAYKFSSKPILVPYELLEDSAFDLASVLGAMLGERLGRITNTYYTTGDAANKPKGIITAAGSFSAASSSAIAFDDILGLEHSIDPAYRQGASFMMHDSILLVIRKLKDSYGQYLWQNGISIGRPDTLAGYPLQINQDMDSTVTSGKKTILFGNLSNYKIRRVNGVRLYRLTERYRDYDQDGFVAFVREDGNLLTSGTTRVKYLAQ
mgnify:CR=1 FL=1